MLSLGFPSFLNTSESLAKWRATSCAIWFVTPKWKEPKSNEDVWATIVRNGGKVTIWRRFLGAVTRPRRIGRFIVAEGTNGAESFESSCGALGDLSSLLGCSSSFRGA